MQYKGINSKTDNFHKSKAKFTKTFRMIRFLKYPEDAFLKVKIKTYKFQS